MQLTENFSLEEMTFSSTAQRLGIDNTPDLETISRLTVCAMGLEQIRALLGSPMHIDSGFRCPALNKAVRGAVDSAHLVGYAADFLCPGFGIPLSIVHAIASSSIAFDQLIQEGDWTHVSFDPRARRQILTAHFSTDGTTYSAGA